MNYRYLLIAGVLLIASAVGAFAQAIQNVEVHGYMLNRFYAPESGSARVVTERVSLSAQGQLGADGKAYIELYFHPWMTDDVLPSSANPRYTLEQYRTYLESAYVDLPLGAGRVRFGKGRQLNFGITPSYPNRKTTQYGIVSETFTMPRIVGLQYAQKFGNFDWGATLYQDYRMGNAKIGYFPNAPSNVFVPHFVNKDDNANLSSNLAGSIKLGLSSPCFSWHVSAAKGKLEAEDIAFIAAQYPSGTSDNSDDHTMYGFDMMWSPSPFVLKGEWYSGDFSFLNITGYSFLVGYEPKDKTRFYVRYETLNNDQPAVGNPYTWDTQQLTFGIVQPIRKGVWVELNYEQNMEDPPVGTPGINNNLLFLEVFTGF